MFSDEVMTGTTIIAIKYSEGVIIGADTRTSSGIHVANYTSNKLTQLTDKIFCCRSGSAADTKMITDIVTAQNNVSLYADGDKSTVKRLSTYCKNLIYKYPQLLAGIIVAGYDDLEKGSVYTVTLGGSLVKQDIALGGSGSPYLYGYCDTFYKNDFNKDDGVNFVKEVLKMAIRRDNFSGGCARLAVITQNEVEHIYVPGNEI
ncbi:Proteasome subunit beta type-1 [Binucleata daphniae]